MKLTMRVLSIILLAGMVITICFLPWLSVDNYLTEIELTGLDLFDGLEDTLEGMEEYSEASSRTQARWDDAYEEAFGMPFIPYSVVHLASTACMIAVLLMIVIYFILHCCNLRGCGWGIIPLAVCSFAHYLISVLSTELYSVDIGAILTILLAIASPIFWMLGREPKQAAQPTPQPQYPPYPQGGYQQPNPYQQNAYRQGGYQQPNPYQQNAYRQGGYQQPNPYQQNAYRQGGYQQPNPYQQNAYPQGGYQQPNPYQQPYAYQQGGYPPYPQQPINEEPVKPAYEPPKVEPPVYEPQQATYGAQTFAPQTPTVTDFDATIPIPEIEAAQADLAYTQPIPEMPPMDTPAYISEQPIEDPTQSVVNSAPEAPIAAPEQPTEAPAVPLADFPTEMPPEQQTM